MEIGIDLELCVVQFIRPILDYPLKGPLIPFKVCIHIGLLLKLVVGSVCTSSGVVLQFVVLCFWPFYLSRPLSFTLSSS